MTGRGSGSRPAFPERRFHRWLAAFLPPGSTGQLPMGDDVAALKVDGRRSLLLTTDALSEGTHFLRASPPQRIGRAAIHASLSDLASKGGVPLAALLDLLLPPRSPEAWARRVVQGAEAASRSHGFHVVGGDTKPAAGRSVVGTVVGWGGPRLAPRSGARPGDLLITTGTVGRGGARACRWARSAPSDSGVLAELLEIEPRVTEGQWLVGIGHAMLDTSDGLAEAGRLLGEASGVRIVLEPDRIPYDPLLLRLDLTPRRQEEVAFFGGDYELLAAVPPRAWELASRRPANAAPFSIVGRVERGRGVVVVRDGRRRDLRSRGWDPFRRTRPRPR